MLKCIKENLKNIKEFSSVEIDGDVFQTQFFEFSLTDGILFIKKQQDFIYIDTAKIKKIAFHKPQNVQI